MSLRARPLTTITAAFALLLSTFVAVVALGGPAAAAGTVTVSVSGQGSVTGAGINCTQTGGPDCSQLYPNVQECDDGQPPLCVFVPPDVELTAGPDGNGYLFNGFTGCDTTTGRTCGITVTAATSVVASFRDAAPPSLPAPSPGTGAHHGTIVLAASPTDNSGAINRVEFRVRGVLVATDTSAPYSTPFNTAMVADGSAAISATAYDAAGNGSSSSSTITFDNTAPSLSVTGPDGQAFGPGTTQSWTISASDVTSAVQTVQCSLVPAGSADSFGACSGGTSGHSVSNKPEGSYDFAVKATDGAGNVTEVDRAFAVDATPPDTSVTSGPADGSVLTVRSVAFGFSATEAGSTFQCRFYTTGATPTTFGLCPVAYVGLADGGYRFEVRSVDPAGNIDASPAARDFTVDATPPDTSLTSGPGAGSVVTASTVTFGFSATEAGSTFQCRLYPAGTTPTAFAACSGPATHTASGLADGGYRFEVRAVDTAGNADASAATRDFTVDATAPLLAVSGPDGQTFGPGTTQTWTIAASDVTTGPPSVQCSLVAAGSPASFGVCSGGASGHSVTNEPGGRYDFVVRATDGAGNVTEAHRSFTIDATPPDTMLTNGPGANSVVASRTVTFGFSTTEAGSTFQCRLYPSGTTAPPFAACSGSASHTASGLADGGYRFEVRAVDAVGNTEASPASRDFAVDATAPQAALTKQPPKKVKTKKKTAKVTFAFIAEPGATFRCSLDSAAFTACPATVSYKVKVGKHTLQVVAVDAAGNVQAAPVTSSFKVKRVKKRH